MFSKIQLLLLAGSFFLALSAWGPALYSSEPMSFYTSWQADVCETFCHRIPERSLTIGEIKTTACGRCTGIFTGLFLGAWLVLNLNVAPFLIFFAALNTIDGFAGLLNAWNIGNLPRTGLGFGLGFLFSVTILQLQPATLLSWTKKRTS